MCLSLYVYIHKYTNIMYICVCLIFILKFYSFLPVFYYILDIPCVQWNEKKNKNHVSIILLLYPSKWDFRRWRSTGTGGQSMEIAANLRFTIYTRLLWRPSKRLKIIGIYTVHAVYMRHRYKTSYLSYCALVVCVCVSRKFFFNVYIFNNQI